MIPLAEDWEREYPALRTSIGRVRSIVAFRRVRWNSSVRKATQLSIILIALVNAAKNRSIKNRQPNPTPPGILPKTSGKAIKATPPPCPKLSAPKVTNTTGTIAKAARIATIVSTAQITPALLAKFSFLGT